MPAASWFPHTVSLFWAAHQLRIISQFPEKEKNECDVHTWIFNTILNVYTCTKSPTYEPSSCELSKMRTCVLSASGVSDIAACPPSPVAENPSPLPSPISHLLHQWLFLPVHSMQPLYAGCCTRLLYSSRCYTVRFKLFFLVCVFVYYLCEKYYKSTTLQYYITDCVRWVPRLTLLDSQTCFQNGTHLHVGNLLCIYFKPYTYMPYFYCT